MKKVFMAAAAAAVAVAVAGYFAEPVGEFLEHMKKGGCDEVVRSECRLAAEAAEYNPNHVDVSRATADVNDRIARQQAEQIRKLTPGQ